MAIFNIFFVSNRSILAFFIIHTYEKKKKNQDVTEQTLWIEELL